MLLVLRRPLLRLGLVEQQLLLQQAHLRPVAHPHQARSQLGSGLRGLQHLRLVAGAAACRYGAQPGALDLQGQIGLRQPQLGALERVLAWPCQQIGARSLCCPQGMVQAPALGDSIGLGRGGGGRLLRLPLHDVGMAAREAADQLIGRAPIAVGFGVRRAVGPGGARQGGTEQRRTQNGVQKGIRPAALQAPNALHRGQGKSKHGNISDPDPRKAAHCQKRETCRRISGVGIRKWAV